MGFVLELNDTFGSIGPPASVTLYGKSKVMQPI